MPEGHTIHRIAKDHTPLLTGRPVRVSSPQGRFVDEARLVDGVVLERIEPYGKHLFLHWENGLVGHVHLGLFGRYRVTKGEDEPEPRGEVRMRLRTDLATVDLSGPTDCSLGPVARRDEIIARLGPDPLRRDGRPGPAIERISRSDRAIAALLLDQRVIAGVGNVYRAEVLYAHGIRPDRPGSGCTADELMAMWQTIVAMLRRGVRDNRIVTVDPREVEVPPGRSRRGSTTYVYHRQRCLRCGSAVATIELGGRDCWFCPICQPT